MKSLDPPDSKSKKKLSKAEAFNAVLTFAEAKQMRLRDYCVNHLKMTFVGNYSYCPMHGGHTGHSFMINDKTQKWQCWSECPQKCPRHGSKPYDKDRPCTCRGDIIDLQRLPKLPISERTGKRPTDKACFAKRKSEQPQLSLRHLPAIDLRSHSPIKHPEAKDFANWWLGILQPEDLPIVFETKYQAIIGDRAKRALSKCPQRMQYLCQSTGIDSRGSNTDANLKERLFLDVEFDYLPLAEQAKILWWLKTRRKWNLVSVTFSGGKSNHGLFYVRHFSDEEVAKMERLALSLGACEPTMRAHQPVRFPGGWRTKEDWRQTGVCRQEMLYFDPIKVYVGKQSLDSKLANTKQKR